MPEVKSIPKVKIDGDRLIIEDCPFTARSLLHGGAVITVEGYGIRKSLIEVLLSLTSKQIEEIYSTDEIAVLQRFVAKFQAKLFPD